MQSRFNFRSPLTLLLTGLLLYVVFGLLWWNLVFMGPTKSFEDMLANNLTTSSVTKNEFITANSQANLQRITLQLGHDNLVRSLVTLRTANASATTESLGMKGVAYIRYVDIKDPKGHDFAKVTNVWAKSGNDPQTATLSKLFNQSLLDINAAPVPPLGYVAPEKRADMLSYMKNEAVFTPDYKTVKQATVNGRQVYVYDVSVKLAPYLRLMQDFAHIYGLSDLDSISATDYQSAQPVQISIAVDKLSHQMVRASKADNGFNETYTDYGIEHHFTVPQKTISTQELRQRLGSAH